MELDDMIKQYVILVIDNRFHKNINFLSNEYNPSLTREGKKEKYLIKTIRIYISEVSTRIKSFTSF